MRAFFVACFAMLVVWVILELFQIPIDMKRLESLDALRGFDMIFIMGGASLIAAIAALFPDSQAWGLVSEQMEHASWEGLRHHDTIFPLFLFIAGVTWPFSLQNQLDKGKSQCDIRLKVVRRGLMLVLLGLLYNGLLYFDFANLRFCSVLSRIGLGWMFGALIYMAVKNNKIRIAIVAAILVGYWLVMAFIPAPDAPVGTDIFSKEGSIACWLDKVILGAHSFRPEYDPEGLFSTIPAIGTALLGMLSGEWVRKENVSGNKKALGMFVAGVAMAVIGWLWNFVFPINKALWSSSFVCAVAGYSLIMFSIFYYIIDVRGWRKWAKFFVVIGLNSITIYMAQRFNLLDGIQHKVFDGCINLAPENLQRVVEEISWIATCWLFLYILYRKRIFLKV